MNSMKVCVRSLTLLLAGVLFGQEAPKDSATTKSPETTLTGCLSKGSGSAQYVLTDQATGNKTPVTGTSELEQHVNHTVKLTGANTTENGRALFTAAKVEHISATCMAKK